MHVAMSPQKVDEKKPAEAGSWCGFKSLFESANCLQFKLVLFGILATIR